MRWACMSCSATMASPPIPRVSKPRRHRNARHPLGPLLGISLVLRWLRAVLAGIQPASGCWCRRLASIPIVRLHVTLPVSLCTKSCFVVRSIGANRVNFLHRASGNWRVAFPIIVKVCVGSYFLRGAHVWASDFSATRKWVPDHASCVGQQRWAESRGGTSIDIAYWGCPRLSLWVCE